MVLEFVSGGEMFTHLRNSNKFRYDTHADAADT